MMVRRARVDELDLIMGIYEEARVFMAANGNAGQWSGGYPGRELVTEDLEKGQLYVYEEDGRIGAVFVFFVGEEPNYGEIRDGKWLDDEPYGTLHRIAVVVKGRGIASKCLKWCFEQCGNMRGDTHEKNKSMQRLFDKNGFVRCGIVTVDDGTERIAYQKNSAMIGE